MAKPYVNHLAKAGVVLRAITPVMADAAKIREAAAAPKVKKEKRDKWLKEAAALDKAVAQMHVEFRKLIGKAGEELDRGI